MERSGKCSFQHFSNMLAIPFVGNGVSHLKAELTTHGQVVLVQGYGTGKTRTALELARSCFLVPLMFSQFIERSVDLKACVMDRVAWMKDAYAKATSDDERVQSAYHAWNHCVEKSSGTGSTAPSDTVILLDSVSIILHRNDFRPLLRWIRDMRWQCVMTTSHFDIAYQLGGSTHMNEDDIFHLSFMPLGKFTPTMIWSRVEQLGKTRFGEEFMLTDSEKEILSRLTRPLFLREFETALGGDYPRDVWVSEAWSRFRNNRCNHLLNLIQKLPDKVHAMAKYFDGQGVLENDQMGQCVMHLATLTRVEIYNYEFHIKVEDPLVLHLMDSVSVQATAEKVLEACETWTWDRSTVQAISSMGSWVPLMAWHCMNRTLGKRMFKSRAKRVVTVDASKPLPADSVTEQTLIRYKDSLWFRDGGYVVSVVCIHKDKVLACSDVQPWLLPMNARMHRFLVCNTSFSARAMYLTAEMNEITGSSQLHLLSLADLKLPLDEFPQCKTCAVVRKVHLQSTWESLKPSKKAKVAVQELRYLCQLRGLRWTGLTRKELVFQLDRFNEVHALQTAFGIGSS